MKDILYKLPQEFIHKLKKIYPHRFSTVCDSFTQKKISAFRINYLKTDLPRLRKSLQHERVRFQELAFPKGAFLLKSTLRDFQKTSLYRDGAVYVQNVSSQLAPYVLEPKDTDTILDLCAAPGAKTTQMLSLAPGAKIVAIEKIRIRFYKLLANLKIQGADSVKPLLLEGTLVRKKYPEYFDKILLDAPCSSEGRFNIHNPKSYKYWKLRKVKEMAHKQKKLFRAAFFALKEGGSLIYSTCTFSPEENELIIEWALNKFKDAIALEPVAVPLENSIGGLTHWQGKRLPDALRATRRILPNEYMEGFFIAKMRKISV